MQESRIFTTSWDRLVAIITGAVALLIAALAIVMFRDRAYLGAAVLALVLAMPALWAPRRYRLDGDVLIVEQAILRARIPLATIVAVEILDGETIFRRCIRLFGSGGLYGVFGLFRGAALGTFHAYATRISGPMVVLRRHAGHPLVVSPDDAEAFADAVRERIPVKMSAKDE